MTTRAARWATVQVGRYGRAVSEVADDLGCDWHTVMDAVVVFGEPLIDDPARFTTVNSVGLDETLYVREGVYRRQLRSTHFVDVQRGQLLDVVITNSILTVYDEEQARVRSGEDDRNKGYEVAMAALETVVAVRSLST